MPSWSLYAPGLVRMVWSWSAFGRASSNTMWFQLPHAPTRDDCFALAENWAIFDSNVWAGFRSDDHQLDSIASYSADRNSGAMYSRQGVGQGGAIPAAAFKMLPAPQAPVAEELIADAWRGRRRLYLSGMTETLTKLQDDTTVLLDLEALAVETALNDWLAFINGLGPGRLVAVKGYEGGVKLEPALTSPIVSYHVNRHWTGTQVRRGPTR